MKKKLTEGPADLGSFSGSVTDQLVVVSASYYVPRLSWISPDIRHYIKIGIVLLEFLAEKANKFSGSRISFGITKKRILEKALPTVE